MMKLLGKHNSTIDIYSKEGIIFLLKNSFDISIMILFDKANNNVPLLIFNFVFVVNFSALNLLKSVTSS